MKYINASLIAIASVMFVALIAHAQIPSIQSIVFQWTQTFGSQATVYTFQNVTAQGTDTCYVASLPERSENPLNGASVSISCVR